MAKAHTYIDVDTSSLSKPLAVLFQKEAEAREAFETALITAAVKKGTIPAGQYGTVSRNFGKVSIAISDEPPRVRGQSKSVQL